MADDLPQVLLVVAQMRGLAAKERTAHLQRAIGQPTDQPNLLHQRALLLTALREAELWPEGCGSVA